MTAQLKTTLISIFTSLIVAACGGLVAKNWLTADQSTQLAGLLATAAVGAIPGIAAIIYKAWPASAASKIDLAQELPEVSRVVTTEAIASSPQFATNPVVLSQPQAAASPPPAPVAE